MRTTLDLPDDLHAYARQVAHEQRRSMGDVIGDLIRAGLQQTAPSTAAVSPITGIRTVASGHQVNQDEVRAIEDDEVRSIDEVAVVAPAEVAPAASTLDETPLAGTALAETSPADVPEVPYEVQPVPEATAPIAVIESDSAAAVYEVRSVDAESPGTPYEVRSADAEVPATPYEVRPVDETTAAPYEVRGIEDTQ